MRRLEDTLAQLRRGALQGATRLDLDHAGLTTLPDEVFALADTLEVLNLSGNALRDLPAHLPRLHRLRVLFCSHNPFTHLPPVVGACAALETVGFRACAIDTVSAAALPPGLRALILTDNRLTELPAALGHSTQLQKLMLAGNQLHDLPESLAQCASLALLRISANRFEALPPVIHALPNLAWLAAAGNPVTDRAQAARQAAAHPSCIDWSALALHERLGEGASGHIHRATWRPAEGGAPRAVAVKLFKGAMTSDGLPRSEMAASLTCGVHEGLVGARGRVTGHPDGAQGLVLDLIDPAFQTLAAPPSLQSCTRDVYSPKLHLTAAQAKGIDRTITEAMHHLHAQGVLHGDLYAHNIQWNPSTGAALLGDLGAASFLPVDDDAWSETLCATDRRALGHLREELAQLQSVT